MARRTLNRHDLRAEVEAAEARGIPIADPRKASRPRSEPTRRPAQPVGQRTRIVWAVCDVGGRTVATFDYVDKASAEALILELKGKGKGTHFLRSVKEPIESAR
jgi:hypothetical protein